MTHEELQAWMDDKRPQEKLMEYVRKTVEDNKGVPMVEISTLILRCVCLLFDIHKKNIEDLEKKVEDQEEWHFSGKPEIPEGSIWVIVIVCADNQIYPLKYRRVTVRGKEQYRYEWMFGNIYGNDDRIKAWRYLPKPPKEGEA